MSRAYEKREIAGFEFGARCIYRGSSVVRYELVKCTAAPWPGDEALLKFFGERGLGGQVKHTGMYAMVEIYVD